MITSPFSFLSLLMLFITAVLFCDRKLHIRLFKIIPPILFIYIGGMIGASLHVWQLTPELVNFISGLKSYLLPMMLFMLLLKNDIRDAFRLGPRLLGTFLAATTSIILGFILVYTCMHHLLDDDAWQTFSILSSSWIGGTTNMAATQQGLEVPEGATSITYALIMDNVCANCWILLMISLAPLRAAFNRFSGAHRADIDKIISQIHLHVTEREEKRSYEFMDFMLTIGLGMAVAGIVIFLGKQCINPAGLSAESALYDIRTFFSGSSWVVILATLAGILGSMTPMNKIKGPDHIGSVMLYIVLGLISCLTDVSSIDIQDVAYYILSGALILGFHLIILLLLAKIFKLDLYICGIASMANIGGLASAPVVAGVYDQSLIPAGLVMAVFGAAIGTVSALLLAKLLILI